LKLNDLHPAPEKFPAGPIPVSEKRAFPHAAISNEGKDPGEAVIRRKNRAWLRSQNDLVTVAVWLQPADPGNRVIRAASRRLNGDQNHLGHFILDWCNVAPFAN
jgi:hypothetical protein